ncbi:hypothetical protein [Leptospirillum ferriphilum]|uniref:hypothetical protein n=1 Tax=Leptospirillum ferriphilum TaxID=178606 RepID=UPI00117BB854|nr:hypothetical protein [Leptospirillum ferriphilum]
MSNVFVTYNPNATSPVPVGQLGSGTPPNPVAILTLSSTEQSLIVANDPTSILVDTTTSPPSIISNPNFWTQRGPYYIAQQMTLAVAGFNKAITSPYTFTNAAGVTSNYPVNSTLAKEEYSNAFLKYVQNGQTLPSGFTFNDINGVPQAFTVTDIENFYNGYTNFFQQCKVSLNSLLASIKTSTSYSQCISYTWTTPS